VERVRVRPICNGSIPLVRAPFGGAKERSPGFLGAADLFPLAPEAPRVEFPVFIVMCDV
jgi:hypothetical protein